MSRAFKSKLLNKDGRSFKANWYLQANGLLFVGVTVTNGKNLVSTHGANLTDSAADMFVAVQSDLFFAGIEHERDKW